MWRWPSCVAFRMLSSPLWRMGFGATPFSWPVRWTTEPMHESWPGNTQTHNQVHCRLCIDANNLKRWITIKCLCLSGLPTVFPLMIHCRQSTSSCQEGCLLLLRYVWECIYMQVSSAVCGTQSVCVYVHNNCIHILSHSLLLPRPMRSFYPLLKGVRAPSEGTFDYKLNLVIWLPPPCVPFPW